MSTPPKLFLSTPTNYSAFATKTKQHLNPQQKQALKPIASTGSFLYKHKKGTILIPSILIAGTLALTQLSPTNTEMMTLIITIFGYLILRAQLFTQQTQQLAAQYLTFAHNNKLDFQLVGTQTLNDNAAQHIPTLQRDNKIIAYQIFTFPQNEHENIKLYNIQSKNTFLTSGGFGTKTRTIGVIELPPHYTLNNDSSPDNKNTPPISVPLPLTLAHTSPQQTLLTSPHAFNFTEPQTWETLAHYLTSLTPNNT